MFNQGLRYNNGLNIASHQLITREDNFPMDKRTPVSDTLKEDIPAYYHEYYVSVNSADRDPTNYPLHYDYRINLDKPYKNVKRVELISAILPNQGATSSSGDILNEPYMIVDVQDLNYIEFPNTSNMAKGFAILPIKAPTKASGGFINPELGCIYNKSKVFRTPLASLNNFHIRLRDYRSNLYDFGVAEGTFDKTHQNAFIFKITTEEFVPLKHHNVF